MAGIVPENFCFATYPSSVTMGKPVYYCPN
jgi:hypothetical protein